MCPTLESSGGRKYPIQGDVNAGIQTADTGKTECITLLHPKGNESIFQLNGQKGFKKLSSDENGNVNHQPPDFSIEIDPETPLSVDAHLSGGIYLI